MAPPDRPDDVGDVDRVVAANGGGDEIDRIERGIRSVLRERYQTLSQNDRTHLVLLLASPRQRLGSVRRYEPTGRSRPTSFNA